MVSDIKRYKVKPLDCWRKCKELRDKYYEEMWSSPAEGRVLAAGCTDTPRELLVGFGAFDYIGGEPYSGTFAGLDPELAMECFEALEDRGFSRDLCGYLRLYWGGLILNKSPFGPPPKPDFYLTVHICDHHAKWFQFAAEYQGVPLITIETPHSFTAEDLPIAIDYMAEQYWDAIERMEKILGRKCDDEKLSESVYTVTENMVLWAKICEYQRFIPAPFDIKHLVSMMVPNLQGGYRKETTEYLKEVLAEVQDRVANEIGTFEIERARIWHINTPPWFALRIMKHPNLYGAVVLGPTLYHRMNSHWTWNEDHTEMIPGKTVQEEGIELKSREDALRFIAQREFPPLGGGSMVYTPMDSPNRDYEVLCQMRKYKCDAAMLHINRGCPLQTTGILSVKRYLTEHGIPAMVYEGNFVDPRDLNESQVIDSLDSLMKSMGLTMLNL